MRRGTHNNKIRGTHNNTIRGTHNKTIRGTHRIHNNIIEPPWILMNP